MWVLLHVVVLLAFLCAADGTCVFRDTTNNFQLDLRYYLSQPPLQGDEGANIFYWYSPCTNGQHCNNFYGQIRQQTLPYSNHLCKIISAYNQTVKPTFSNETGTQIWSFHYSGGQTLDCPGSVRRAATIEWHCDAFQDGYIVLVNETTTCHYKVKILSKWACLGASYDVNDKDASLDWRIVALLIVSGCLFVIVAAILISLLMLKRKRETVLERQTAEDEAEHTAGTLQDNASGMMTSLLGK